MFSYLQKIGKSLMVPVSVLPVAAVLMGVGYWIDPVGWGSDNVFAALLIKSGGALIDNMGILFAIGVSYGMSKDQDGAAALTGLVAWLIITTLLNPGTVAQLKNIPLEQVSPSFAKIQNQFIGILCGVIASIMYNKFYKIELSPALAFFSGKRFVPIITASVMIGISFILIYIWPIVFKGLVNFGIHISGLGPLGAGLYGFFNRLLIPIGLHHALNSVFWFDVAGINDIGNFWASKGVKGVTGMYQAGFFPIMMFGLVGGAFAFIKTAKPGNYNRVKSIMLAAAFASFFTGVTEPIEFSFMFLAPALYFLHAVLTGLSLYIAAKLKFIAGFGFSAGLVDLILSSQLPLANHPYMLIVQGLGFFVVYYCLFLFLIKKFDLKTPGREEIQNDSIDDKIINSHTEVAEIILKALGGGGNIISVDHCTTRLRIAVADSSLIDEIKLKTVSLGVIKPSAKSVQIIIGPQVEFVTNELKKIYNFEK